MTLLAREETTSLNRVVVQRCIWKAAPAAPKTPRVLGAFGTLFFWVFSRFSFSFVFLGVFSGWTGLQSGLLSHFLLSAANHLIAVSLHLGGVLCWLKLVLHLPIFDVILLSQKNSQSRNKILNSLLKLVRVVGCEEALQPDLSSSFSHV